MRREEKSKWFSHLGLMVLWLWCLPANGCDAPEKDSQHVSQKTNSLESTENRVGEESNEKRSDDVVDRGELGDPDIETSWVTEEAEYKAVDADVLYLKVKNHLSIPMNVSVEVRFSGMLNASASIELERQHLEAGDEVYLSVDADAIPVQTTKGVCATIAFAEGTFHQNGKRQTCRSTSDTLYYRHKPNYKGLKFFKEKVFLNQYNGEFFNLADYTEPGSAENARGFVLGRVKNKKDNKFNHVTFKIENANEPILIGTGMAEISLAELEKLEQEARNDK